MRTTHSLYTLVQPQIQLDSLHSLQAMAEAKGFYPRWPQGAGESGSMFGDPAFFLLAESYFKGMDFDYEKTVPFILQSRARRENDCQFMACPVDIHYSVSRAQEYAWADHRAAEFFMGIGETDLANEYFSYAKIIEQMWDPKQRYFVPLRDGKHLKIKPHLLQFIDVKKWNYDAYAEGSPHQWRYSMQQDPKRLIELMGGNEKFSLELNKFMQGASKRVAAINPTGRYWHGNQHDLHAIYLFNEAGRADLTQKWARWAERTRYQLKTNGIDGNDDGGTLSAWYVLNALGLYPQIGTNRYWLGSPVINRAVLKNPKGDITISTLNQGPKNVYVKRVYLNGELFEGTSITHQQLLGSHLEFYMSDKP
jgi:predicted alpha-1,2-mannosidase